jgi:formylglycine-generating enzyme required for sulfatase activity
MAGQLVACTVTASDGKSGTDTDTGSVTIGNTAPVVTSVTLSPSTVYTSDTLTATVVSSDADGDSLTTSYAWTVGGSLVSATSSTLIGSSYFSKGQAVYVTATANDGTTSTSLSSSAITVSNTAPTAPVVAITPVDAVSGDDLTCSVTTASTDADGDALTYSFAWDVDGVDYTSATDAATSSVVDGVDVGGEEVWTCEVVAGDGTSSGAAGSDSVTTASGFTDYTTSDGSLMVAITAGTFEMGSAEYFPVHTVTLTHDFWIGETELTQAQYRAGMGTSPSYFSTCGTTCPVEQVSWEDAAMYANALSADEGMDLCYTATGDALVSSLAGDPYACEGYRLPTEAEWEYAARAGEAYTYSGSDTVGTVAWTNENSGRTTHPVATRTANAWGLYDMSGNVFEYTNDWFGAYSSGAVADPKGASWGWTQVIRGGCWGSDARDPRVSARSYPGPSYRGDDVGFRLARSAP